ncbi:MAG: hypothetical protein MZV63_45415 [Marinilabiliales bacterium]|nr:hypothetical protein [Marinilabiliales bacterium]
MADAKYDGYKVTASNNVIITAGYTDISIGTVNKKLEVETKYGNLSVDKIPAGFSGINVKAGYCSVKLGIDPAACYNLKANSSYGSVKVDDANFYPTGVSVGNTSTELEGKVGKCSNPNG